ncbi:MAG: ABC transporter ATP-binding protein [Thermofilum sp.]|nr:ABC transporter ATP-binding protein [Thermofilum sp.]
MIAFEGVVKRFGATEALRGATFTVPKGVVAGLLGPNGAGKTTTIKIAAGLLRRDGGRVSVLGLDPWEQGEELRERVGVLHERPAYPPDVPVKVLLRHVARIRGLGWEDALQAAKLAGVERYLERPVSALSRGYLQRLGLAIALLGEPELLLLDEPTANLDPSARREVLAAIKTLGEEMGATIVISSHIIPEMEQVCNYAVIISGGVVLAQGSLTDLATAFGAEVEFVARSREPRRLASLLVSEEGVRGVEVEGDRVVARAASSARQRLEALLEKARLEGLALGWELRSRSLGEVYERAVQASR